MIVLGALRRRENRRMNVSSSHAQRSSCVCVNNPREENRLTLCKQEVNEQGCETSVAGIADSITEIKRRYQDFYEE